MYESVRINEHTVRLRGLLGEKVRTPDGIGILLNKVTPCNGLYFDDDATRWLVWYGTEQLSWEKGHPWITREYHGEDIHGIE